MVVVTMFERGEDDGDEPGEFQFWKERRGLSERFAFPQGHHDLYYNPESQILGVVTGIGTAKSAAATMALGLDPRFDLRQAYWLVAGIAGIDPEDASIGSAVWSAYLVDGDLGYEIDAREIPSGWQSGFFPLGTAFPSDPDKPEPRGEVFVTNIGLRDWAFELTRNTTLADDPGLAEARASYVDHPNARKPPFVTRGGHIAAMTFWHGALKNALGERLRALLVGRANRFRYLGHGGYRYVPGDRVPAPRRANGQEPVHGSARGQQLHRAGSWHHGQGQPSAGDCRFLRHGGCLGVALPGRFRRH